MASVSTVQRIGRRSSSSSSGTRGAATSALSTRRTSSAGSPTPSTRWRPPSSGSSALRAWNVENDLLWGFARYARREMQHREITVGTEFVALAQHYGLPTRAVDWSYSPYVAAYFATRGRSDVDGVIRAVDYAKVHERLPPEFRALLDDASISVFEADVLDDNLVPGARRRGRPRRDARPERHDVPPDGEGELGDTGGRPPRGLRGVLRGAVGRRANRQPVGAVLGEGRRPHPTGRAARSQRPERGDADRDPGRLQARVPRTARTGRHHRQEPLPRTRRHHRLAL